MNPTAAKMLETHAARIELEIPIEAPLTDVWRAVSEEPDAWWVSDMRCVPGGSTLALDPRAGGRLIEQNDSGGSLLWATVIAVQPPRSLSFESAIAPPFGGPCKSFLLIELEERGAGTLLKLTNSLHGHVDESSLPEMESGWRLLFETGLKQLVEARQRA